MRYNVITRYSFKYQLNEYLFFLAQYPLEMQYYYINDYGEKVCKKFIKKRDFISKMEI